MDALLLTVRTDGTYDYHFGPGMTRPSVIASLRDIADQIEEGVDIDTGALV